MDNVLTCFSGHCLEFIIVKRASLCLSVCFLSPLLICLQTGWVSSHVAVEKTDGRNTGREREKKRESCVESVIVCCNIRVCHFSLCVNKSGLYSWIRSRYIMGYCCVKRIRAQSYEHANPSQLQSSHSLISARSVCTLYARYSSPQLFKYDCFGKGSQPEKLRNPCLVRCSPLCGDWLCFHGGTVRGRLPAGTDGRSHSLSVFGLRETTCGFDRCTSWTPHFMGNVCKLCLFLVLGGLIRRFSFSPISVRASLQCVFSL